MAKIKRTIRKIQPLSQMLIEEQLWPLYLALVLFGGLLSGIALAYLRFDDATWYRNALTWLLFVPLFVGAAMVGLYFINTHTMRRSVQLAMVLGILLHVLIFWPMYHWKMSVAGSNQPKTELKKATKPLQLKVAIERPTPVHKIRDFEKPVETPQPEASTKIVEKQDTPQPSETQKPPTPVALEEIKPTPTTALAQKAESGATTPRLSDSPSQLSRQMSKLAPTTNRSADAPQVAAAAATKTETKPEVTVAKATTDNKAEAKSPTPEASATPTTNSTAKRDTTAAPTTAADSPTIKKTETQTTPATALAKVELPSTTKATDTAAVTPRTVSPDKRPTTAAQVAANAEPSPETPNEVKPEVVRRATEAEKKPTVASAAESVPNPRPRETTRPSVSTIASTQATAATPQQTAQTQEVAQPTGTQVAKATTATSQVQAAKTAEATQPTTAPASSPSTTARNNSTASPDTPTTVATVTSPKKSTSPGAPSASASTTAETVAVTKSATGGEVSPTSVAVAKQATESAQTAPAAGSPAAASVAGVATSAAANSSTRRETTQNAATPTDNPQVAARGKSSATSPLNVNSAADTVTSQVGANVAANTATVGPSSAEVARQATNSPNATSSRQPLPEESLSPATSVATSGSTKASAGSVPTINPSRAPSNSPQRAISSAEVAASPTNVETPSIASTATGQGDASASPARMALSKSLSGTAGVGQSPNLDRSLPAADSPSLVSSGSARREQATQNSPEGPALAPSATSIAGRAQANAELQTSSLKASNLPNASQAGAERVADASASAGASMQRQSSNAAQANVTASVGQVEVDIGPTQTIADSGTSSRASGGGQPTINTESQGKQLARRDVGGSPAASLATNTKADAPVAPSGIGGGTPRSLEVNPNNTAIAKTQAGGEAAATGGPATANQRGPATEVSAAALVGAAPLAKNDNASPGGAPQAVGTPDVASSEAAAPRVAKANGGAPQLAVGGPTVAAVPNVPRGDGGTTPSGEAAPAAIGVAKAGGASGANSEAPTPSAVATGSTGGVIASTNVGRAEAVEATPGSPTAGGGNQAQPRRGTGPALAANTTAAAPVTGGAPDSGGKESGLPVASAGPEVTKTGGAQSSGAVASAAPVSAEPSGTSGGSATGVAIGERAAGGAAAPTVAATSGSSPGRKAPTVQVGGSSAAETLAANPGTLATTTGDNPLAGMNSGAMTRQEVTGATPVNVPAKDGPGGLGAAVASDVGINNRRASNESVDVQVSDSRFIRQKVGGDLSINSGAILPTEGFRKRGPNGRDGGAASPQTEKAIELGLVYLAKHQLPDGSWSLQGHDDKPSGDMLSSDTAATALALLAFQGGGYTHREHKYKDVVNNGVQFLLRNQQKNGDLFFKADDKSNQSAWLYSHALATLAICEAYGMTADPELREPAQRAVDFCIKSQDPARGGWRYVPQAGTDTSVTGWMMVALKSAEEANLKVPEDAFLKIRKWLDVSDGGDGKEHLFRYDPYAPDSIKQSDGQVINKRHGRVVTKTMTSVGLLMRHYLGAKKESPLMQEGGRYLLANPPFVGTVTPKLISDTPRDTYYWYYSTLVMWHMGGEYWERWHAQMHPILVKSQVQAGVRAGSWDPLNPVPDRWGPTAGRLYVTTMNLLSLEVEYRALGIHQKGK